MGLFDGRGTTTVRSRWARRLDGENSDHLMAIVPIPPGCTIQSQHLNHFVVAEEAMPLRQATEYGLHGYIITIPQPYHGYGDGLGAFENMWDDMVPKDRDADDELNTTDDSSVADDNMQNVDTQDDAIEGGFGGSGDGSETGGSNLNAVLNLGAGPEMVFSRVKRLDVTNGIISESQKFTAVDKVQTRLSKRYHVPKDKYGWLMYAVGLPKLEATTSAFADGGIWDQVHQTDYTWQQFAYPEISLLGGLRGASDSNATIWGALLQKNLELAYVDADTYHDVDESAPGKFSAYTNLTVTYQRPRFDQLHLSSRNTV